MTADGGHSARARQEESLGRPPPTDGERPTESGSHLGVWSGCHDTRCLAALCGAKRVAVVYMSANTESRRSLKSLTLVARVSASSRPAGPCPRDAGRASNRSDRIGHLLFELHYHL